MKKSSKAIKIIILILLFAACAIFFVRVISNKAPKHIAEEEIKADKKEVNRLCEELSPEFYFYPGDYNKTKIVKNITTYQGIDYSLVYNPQFYYTYNEDARNACGNDATKLIKYFVTTDMSFGVRANEEFDVASYYNANKDLREQFGPDFPKYYRHYMTTGHNEPERKVKGVTQIEDPITVYNEFDYAPVYDFNYYVENAPELQHYLTIPGPAGCLDDSKAVMQFVEAGIYELRQSSENFDLVSYFLLNPDLWNLYQDNIFAYVIHYANNNQNENRQATGKHNVEEFMQTVYELKPTVEKEAISVLDYVGYNLYSAYAWCAGINYVSLPLSWSIEGYAMYAFGNWRGNCYAKASALYYMAKELGYDAHIVSGYVPLGEDKHMGPHGWVEIGGLVYDPDFETETDENGYGIYYGQEGTWQYSDYWYWN